MDEKEKAHHRRVWHFLDLLGVVTWVMNRGIRGRGLIENVPPRLTGEPPMIELDRLVRLAATGQTPPATLDSEEMEQVASLFKDVAIRDGSVSSEENEAMRSFIESHVREGETEIEVEDFVSAFKDYHHSEAKLKETCFLLRTRLRPGAADQILEALYRLAYLHGLEHEERRAVEKIGEYLGLFSSEIRLAESAARRSIERKEQNNAD